MVRKWSGFLFLFVAYIGEKRVSAFSVVPATHLLFAVSMKESGDRKLFSPSPAIKVLEAALPQPGLVQRPELVKEPSYSLRNLCDKWP